MQIHCNSATLSTLRAFAAPLHCATCEDLMVAPFISEFVEGGEIRHHWVCESCGGCQSTSIPLEVPPTLASGAE